MPLVFDLKPVRSKCRCDSAVVAPAASDSPFSVETAYAQCVQGCSARWSPFLSGSFVNIFGNDAVSQGEFPHTALVQVVNGLEPPLSYDLTVMGIKELGTDNEPVVSHYNIPCRLPHPRSALLQDLSHATFCRMQSLLFQISTVCRNNSPIIVLESDRL
jgi:hypothetical protein